MISGCPYLDCVLRVFDACLDVIFIWDFDMLIVLTDLSWLGLQMPWFFFYVSLIYLFETLTCWLYWLILLHRLAHWLWFCHDCFDHFACIHSPLYITRLDMLILWLVYYFDHLWACCPCITIHLIVVFSLILCVHEWYILLCLTIWCMTALPLHDCM